MNSRTARMGFWMAGALFLLASGWSFNIATYNWVAADSHTQYSRAYASRGNIFFIVALALLAASVVLIVAILRSGRRRQGP